MRATATRRAAAAALRALTSDVDQHDTVLAHNVPAELAKLLLGGDAFSRRESADLLRISQGLNEELRQRVAEAIEVDPNTSRAELKEHLARLALGDDAAQGESPADAVDE